MSGVRRPVATDVAQRVLQRLDPSAGELLALRRELVELVPPGLGDLDREAFVPERVTECPGIDLREPEQLERVERWGAELQPLFAALRGDLRINTLAAGSGVLHNGQYPTPDAEVYAALVAERRPSRILEAGAGFSTLVARRAIVAAGIDCELAVVDPQPRTDVRPVVDSLRLHRIEELAPDDLIADGNSFLFVDSSHVVRAGGDVPFLFAELIPLLPSGTLVHVHDVFLPYDYPDAYRRRLYGEQYVLQALLAGAPRYEVVFATHYMVRRHGEVMRRAFGPPVGVDPLYFGASFWFAVR